MTPPVLTAEQIAAIATREVYSGGGVMQNRERWVPLTVAERDALVARIRELEAEVQSWVSAIERAR